VRYVRFVGVRTTPTKVGQLVRSWREMWVGCPVCPRRYDRVHPASSLLWLLSNRETLAATPASYND
jgi:hypothetical protein